MNAQDVAAVVSAAVGVFGLVLAVYQTRATRRARRSAEARIAEMTAILASSLAQVRSAAQAADALVQQAKDWSTEAHEMVTPARLLRTQLVALARDLAIGEKERATVEKDRARLEKDMETPAPLKERQTDETRQDNWSVRSYMSRDGSPPGKAAAQVGRPRGQSIAGEDTERPDCCS
jgi:hypothetical protein